MEKYYQFAGVSVAVEIPPERMYTQERWLKPFQVTEVTEPHRFTYEVVEALTPPESACVAAFPNFRVFMEEDAQVRYIGSTRKSWEKAYMRAEHRGNDHHIQLRADRFPRTVTVKSVLSTMAVEHLVCQAGGVVFHTSYVEWDGRAILFTAPSGTGKSTQAELWRSLRGAEIINGDRAAIRVCDDSVVAAGIPFAGSSQFCKNRTLPLAAIVYLEQAPATTIRKLRGVEAFSRIWEGISVNTWDQTDLERASDVVEQVIRTVPIYHLACTPDESAVIALEQMLRK